MLITSNIFYNQQLLLHFVGKLYFVCLQEVMFGTPYSYCKVDYSKMTSTNNFEIIPRDILPDAIARFDKFQD